MITKEYEENRKFMEVVRFFRKKQILNNSLIKIRIHILTKIFYLLFKKYLKTT